MQEKYYLTFVSGEQKLSKNEKAVAKEVEKFLRKQFNIETKKGEKFIDWTLTPKK